MDASRPRGRSSGTCRSRLRSRRSAPTLLIAIALATGVEPRQGDSAVARSTSLAIQPAACTLATTDVTNCNVHHPSIGRRNEVRAAICADAGPRVGPRRLGGGHCASSSPRAASASASSSALLTRLGLGSVRLVDQGGCTAVPASRKPRPEVVAGTGAAGSYCRCNTSLLKSGSSQLTGYVTAVGIASSSAVRRR